MTLVTTAVPSGSWTARICRGEPGAANLADLITARGATVRWCGPDCPCRQDGPDDGDEPDE